MTVDELIDELKKFNAEYEVRDEYGNIVARAYERSIERDSVVVGEYVVIQTD